MHTFPHIDFRRTPPVFWSGAPYCPHCGHGSAGLYWDRQPGVEMVRCIVCGWRIERKPRGKPPAARPDPGESVRQDRSGRLALVQDLVMELADCIIAVVE